MTLVPSKTEHFVIIEYKWYKFKYKFYCLLYWLGNAKIVCLLVQTLNDIFTTTLFIMSNCVVFSILFYAMLYSFYIKQYVVLN